MLGKLGARSVVAATLRAVQLLGRQFVLGQSIGDARNEADAARKKTSNLRFSYDMLGEGARTELDAQHYLASYVDAIKSIADGARDDCACELNDGISIKLSALHPRYEDSQRARVMVELVPRVWGLCELAAQANINLTIDAEEVDRLELSLDVFDALQQQMPRFCALLVKEAFKTWGDAVSEVREAVDFLRYYADEAERIMQPVALPGQSHGVMLGVTGETNELRLVARGVWVCISPWNFPLAIFTGQIAAALATGNAVLAKPAEQTPGVAVEAVKLLHAAGVPEGALQLLHGPGDTVGAALVATPGVAGVVFTGSTQVARIINRALAAKDGPIVPLIAETGGINAMLVDSTALPEQVVDAVVQSAFRSAGQRCSALRLLCLHEGIADSVIAMIQGAARELVVGNPAELATDVGPVIDHAAFNGIMQHVQRLNSTSKMAIALIDSAQEATYLLANLIPPTAFELAGLQEVKDEIFGPVLQIVRWGSGELSSPHAVIAQINALGYGLTLGIQTRIDSRAQALAVAADVGNIYVNRNMIGAVVGVQAFGGEGLSGTGPKAGGPHYLQRFCAERSLSINTAAAGGNVALLA